MGQRLEITINRRRFNLDDGVSAQMTPADLANLIGIPPENAVVEREVERDRYQVIPCNSEVSVNDGMHFLITRHFVMGG